MKKLALAILGLTVVSSAVMAQTNQVLSRNAVGYVRVDAPSNKLNMVRLDFVNLAGGLYAVTNLIGTQLAQGSAVYAWDLSNQTYRTANRLARAWDAGGTNQIRRGEGMFIYSASNASVYLMGEVPDSITAPTTRVINLNGLNMTGVPYPVDTPFTNTPWYLGAQSGDVVYFWDIGIQNYVTYNRLSRNWDDTNAVVQKILKPGEGFWAFRNTAGSTNLNFVKPYTWP